MSRLQIEWKWVLVSLIALAGIFVPPLVAGDLRTVAGLGFSLAIGLALGRYTGIASSGLAPV